MLADEQRPFRVRRRIAVALVGLIATLIPTGAAYFNEHTMTGGLVGRHYWLDGSVSSTLEGEVYSSKWLWGNSTSLIALAEASTKNSSEIAVYESSTIYNLEPYGYCGLAYHTDSSWNNVDPNSTNWSRAKLLYASQMVGGASDCANFRGIVLHEFGHAFGLAHVSSGTAIMRVDIAGLTWQAPKADDVDGIDHLY